MAANHKQIGPFQGSLGLMGYAGIPGIDNLDSLAISMVGRSMILADAKKVLDISICCCRSMDSTDFIMLFKVRNLRLADQRRCATIGTDTYYYR